MPKMQSDFGINPSNLIPEALQQPIKFQMSSFDILVQIGF